MVELAGPWATGRCHLGLASIYKDLANPEGIVEYFDYANILFESAL
jgi:hypothetical protein